MILIRPKDFVAHGEAAEPPPEHAAAVAPA
jgi:hypothetical protein